jgi:uncharacterized iron-regulated membrane protein
MIRKLHLYTALSLGALLSVFGLAGSWLVFYPHLDGALLGFETDKSWRDQPVSWNAAYDAAQSAVGPGLGMNGIMMPFGDAGPVIVFTQPDPRATQLDFDLTYVDPADAHVLSAHKMFAAEQSLSRNLAGIAYAIHSGKILGPAQHVAVVVLGLFLLFLAFTGLVLWWPRGRWRRTAFTLATRIGSRAFLGDLHRVSGLYVSLFFCMLVVSGLYYALPEVVSNAVGTVLPVTPRSHAMMHASSHEGHAGHEVDLDLAVATARAAFPGRSLQMLMWMPGSAVQVNLSPNAGDATPIGATEVTVGPEGKVLAVRDPASETVGDKILRWQAPLHTGAAFGVPGRVVVCLLGLLPLAFFVTGIIMWLRRTRAAAQRASSRRHCAAAISTR